MTGLVESGSLWEIQQGWRKAAVISKSYGWGTPWLRLEQSENREGVGLPAIASPSAIGFASGVCRAGSGEAGGHPTSVTL